MAGGKTSPEGKAESGSVADIISRRICHAGLRRHAAVAALPQLREQPGTCAGVEQLQGVRRSAAGLHEKLCRTDLQNRISDVHEVMQEINRDQRHMPSSVSGTTTGQE